ncbi:MAG: type IV toxin-antitoxin system AbiEi family antitoxin domain-containing protein [Candidatus Hydrogenedentes bacterium]|nr:type IV toxin-antitoxin system AbiEi family antitoxin domain-containing protein [Candidatus Hydrogenedentota bacterium]
MRIHSPSSPIEASAIRKIAADGGIVRTSVAIQAGIHPRTLYALRDGGVLEQVSRGVYRLRGHEGGGDPDLITVVQRCPDAVICLISALSLHEITTQVPHAIHLALRRGAEVPRITRPPLEVYHYSPECHAAGIQDLITNGVSLRVYCPEKTLADCFKFRNRIGMDVVLEALKLYRTRMPFKARELLHYARICRVERVMTPYLELLA